MQSQLEIFRQTHEDIERLEQASVHELLKKQKTHRDRFIQEKRTAQYINDIGTKAKELIRLYTDENNIFKEEMLKLEQDDFTEFYDRLQNIKTYYRQMPTELAKQFDPEDLINEELEQVELDRIFTGEEGIARHLDLHSIFQEYINIKDIKRIPYLTYLNRFDRFKDIVMQVKKTTKYFQYLNSLFEYLSGWIRRAQPLFNVEKLENDAAVEFEGLWEKDEVPHWKKPEPQDASLYCVACEKLFSKPTVFEAHKTGKKHLKAAENRKIVEDVQKLVKDQQEFEWQKMKPIAKVEFMIKKYTAHLAPIREDTTSHVERKQTLTEEERLDDQEEHQVDLDSDDDDEVDLTMYNPLKLPIGWDGKPIPFWLYKLHGLGVEYPCEICGGYVYMGRKAFERHFQEFRHAHGMRALGIPNSAQFKDITTIQDAYQCIE
jgi:splicing factor 3A subunit 3